MEMILQIVLIVVLCLSTVHSNDPNSNPVASVTLCTTNNEIICNANCTKVVQCHQTGDTFTQTDLETCSGEKYCFLPLLRCMYHTSCADPTEKLFECTSVGTFPHPYNCGSFYTCVPNEAGMLQATLQQCDDDVAFNSYYKQCRTGRNETYPASCVDGPVPMCLEVGQAGVLAENDSMYYVCHRDSAVLFPVVYECPHGGVYDEVNYNCVDF